MNFTFQFNERFFLSLIIVVLIIIIIIMRSCSPTPPPTKPEIINIRDTVWVQGKDSLVYKPGPIQYIPGDTVFKDVDTVAILKDYFAKVIYSDSIKIDSFGYVYITDTLSQNRIQSRVTLYGYKIPIIKDSTIVKLPPEQKFQMYGGINLVAGPPTGISFFGPQIIIKTKNDQMYNIGLGVNGQGSLSGQFGTAWKIKIKK